MDTQPMISVAFHSMLDSFYPPTIATRSTVALFEGFPIAALGIGISMGSIGVAFAVYMLIRFCGLGKYKWDNPHTYNIEKQSKVRQKYAEHKEKYGLFDILENDKSRSQSRGLWHAAALIISTIIAVFGIYSAFQVCGIDPAIVIGLGILTAVFGWTMADLFVSARRGLEIHLENLFGEGDFIRVNATGKMGEVTWMGVTGFKMEEVTEQGQLIVNYHNYSQVMASGFDRFETGGFDMVYRFKGNARLQVKTIDILKPRVKATLPVTSRFNLPSETFESDSLIMETSFTGRDKNE